MTSEDFKNIRLKFNLSQKEFAKKLGYSIQSISNKENGRRGITRLDIELLRKLKLN